MAWHVEDTFAWRGRIVCGPRSTVVGAQQGVELAWIPWLGFLGIPQAVDLIVYGISHECAPRGSSVSGIEAARVLAWAETGTEVEARIG